MFFFIVHEHVTSKGDWKCLKRQTTTALTFDIGDHDLYVLITLITLIAPITLITLVTYLKMFQAMTPLNNTLLCTMIYIYIFIIVYINFILDDE